MANLWEDEKFWIAIYTIWYPFKIPMLAKAIVSIIDNKFQI